MPTTHPKSNRTGWSVRSSHGWSHFATLLATSHLSQLMIFLGKKTSKNNINQICKDWDLNMAMKTKYIMQNHWTCTKATHVAACPPRKGCIPPSDYVSHPNHLPLLHRAWRHRKHEQKEEHQSKNMPNQLRRSPCRTWATNPTTKGKQPLTIKPPKQRSWNLLPLEAAKEKSKSNIYIILYILQILWTAQIAQLKG